MAHDPAQAMFQSLRSAAGRQVVYRRGSKAIELSAVPGQTNFETLNDTSQVVEQFQSRDFLVEAAELVFDGAATLPQRGDEIDETIRGVTMTFAVFTPGQGSQPYRFSDTGRTVLRIHTKQVAK